MSTSRPATAFTQAEIERLRSTFVELIPYAGTLRESVFSANLERALSLPKGVEEQEQALLSFLAEAIDQATGQPLYDSDEARLSQIEGRIKFDCRKIMALKTPVIETLRLCVTPCFSKEDEKLWESFLTQMAFEKAQEYGRRASGPGIA